MRFKKKKTVKGVVLALAIGSTFVAGGCGRTLPVEESSRPGQVYENTWENASSTPFGKYPQTVEYTLGKMTEAANSHMPEGDTYENNAYTRFLYKELNVQNRNAFEIDGNDDYKEKVAISIASRKLPDVMVVDDEQTLKQLVDKDLIEDLTDVYEKCTSDRIKKIYQSYGRQILDHATFDGRLMALPETNIDNGPSLFWVRKDWMDRLGLKAPSTVSDVQRILKAFVEKDPGRNGKGKTIGLVTRPELTGDCGYAQEYQTDIIFASFGAFPQQWIKDKHHKVSYGSIQPEAKKALATLRKMYKSGQLDRDFLVRNSNNLVDLIVQGKCGAFFGPWWAPNNPLMESMQADPVASWVPYLIATDKKGNTSFAAQNPTGKYVVVRKGYEHPEIVMKITSVLFDKMTYGQKGTEELEDYYKKNVDPTARPLSINVDYKNALDICYRDLVDVIGGGKDPSSLDLLEGSYYSACKDYIMDVNRQMPSPVEWAAYTSRITACRAISGDHIIEIPSYFYGETKTMKTNWWKLQELERQAYLSIVTGDKPLSYFDTFVKTWKKEGGEQITREVAEDHF
ncbi:carbohydrate ABC transporter substrate-binding protein, CUT1 family [Lachnospiraceae bacterium KHCPX20]|nr:carbohydrate ABC transporter substrate-binding protein, CUT1 family [Lachnospiraceae bacterium KHCPX20]